MPEHTYRLRWGDGRPDLILKAASPAEAVQSVQESRNPYSITDLTILETWLADRASARHETPIRDRMFGRYE